MSEFIYDRRGIDRSMKWPWYAKFLLPFCKEHLSGDENYCIRVKQLFGVNYVLGMRER